MQKPLPSKHRRKGLCYLYDVLLVRLGQSENADRGTVAFHEVD